LIHESSTLRDAMSDDDRGSAPYGHSHREREEVYVVLNGSGRMKLNDEIVELRLTARGCPSSV
jgi:hypothetical protein